uniref:NrS-1 polymerase-like helicase domain-containing protein n=2 Tax=viral metagenome TaxID=1070528 RepID=A0A6M3KI06_9ZZZZ
MARICQDPGGKRPKTALVLRGDQGVGKGVFLSNFGKLFGNHFLQINNQQHLTSRFNHHLKDVIFLFVDEGFWAGDKASEGALKGLVTEDILPIEGKGKDVIMLQNHINLAMASNNEWVVPSGLIERRFMVIDVLNDRQQDHDYFGAIDSQLRHGGYEAMLYNLLQYDITQVDVSKVVKTSAGFDQKVESMTPVQKFWFERLRSGMLQNEDRGWTELIQCSVLYTQYLEFCDWIGVRHKKIDRQFGKELKKLCPQIARKYLARTDIGAENYIYKWFYQFPPLEICRDLFKNEVKTGLDWDRDVIFDEDSFDNI